MSGVRHLKTEVKGLEECLVLRSALSEPFKRKTLEFKFLYDLRGGNLSLTGSEIFEEITKTPEYYLTATEYSLLQKYSLSIREALEGEDAVVIEFGSGTSKKV